MSEPIREAKITYGTSYVRISPRTEIRVDVAALIKVHRAMEERLRGMEERLIFGNEHGQASGFWRNMTPRLQALEREASAAWKVQP